MPIKVVHTSDWHLGKKLYKACRLKEQASFLNWLIDNLKQLNADALIIAGDIFDTPHPSSKALKLYFDFLKDVPCPVYLIAGNHDSGRFLEAPKTFLEEKNIHIVGELPQNEDDIKTITIPLVKKQKVINFTLMPYFRTFEILNLANSLLTKDEKDTLENEEAILLTLKRLLDKSLSKGSDSFNILIAHHLFGSFEMSGSEQGLTLSGIESLPTDILKDTFHYAALGHIHKKQELKKENPQVVYSGSPLPFRFSEKNKKSIMLLEIEDNNDFSSHVINIPTFKPLYQIECNLSSLNDEVDKLIKKSKEVNECYLEVRVTLDTPQTGLIDEIRSKIPDNCELLSFYSNLASIKKDKKTKNTIDFEDTVSLFQSYYTKKFPESDKMPEELKTDFLNLLNESRENDRLRQ